MCHSVLSVFCDCDSLLGDCDLYDSTVSLCGVGYRFMGLLRADWVLVEIRSRFRFTTSGAATLQRKLTITQSHTVTVHGRVTQRTAFYLLTQKSPHPDAPPRRASTPGWGGGDTAATAAAATAAAAELLLRSARGG